jgi:hypothetical protein
MKVRGREGGFRVHAGADLLVNETLAELGPGSRTFPPPPRPVIKVPAAGINVPNWSAIPGGPVETEYMQAFERGSIRHFDPEFLERDPHYPHLGTALEAAYFYYDQLLAIMNTDAHRPGTPSAGIRRGGRRKAAPPTQPVPSTDLSDWSTDLRLCYWHSFAAFIAVSASALVL